MSKIFEDTPVSETWNLTVSIAKGLRTNTQMCETTFIHFHPHTTKYRIRRNFRGMKFSLNRKQTGFLQLYFRGSQVHHGKVARDMYCYKSLIV